MQWQFVPQSRGNHVLHTYLSNFSGCKDSCLSVENCRSSVRNSELPSISTPSLSGLPNVSCWTFCWFCPKILDHLPYCRIYFDSWGACIPPWGVCCPVCSFYWRIVRECHSRFFGIVVFDNIPQAISYEDMIGYNLERLL